MTIELYIQGTQCTACKLLIEDVGNEQEGVSSVSVDYGTGITLIHHNKPVDLQSFKRDIEGLGNYTVHLPGVT